MISHRHRKTYELIVACAIALIVGIIIVTMILTMLSIAAGLHRR